MENQNDKEILFRQFLDGELNSEEEKQALHMIAEDSELRDLLRFERTLYQTFSNEPDPESFSVPDGFSDSLMNRIQGEISKKRDDKKSNILKPIFTPKEFSIKPVYAMAAALLLMVSFGLLFLNIDEQTETMASGEMDMETQLVSETESEIWMRFIYFDEEAESIEVAGDFSDWEPIELSQEFMGDRQVWTGLIPITRGEHRYMFVKDGEEWVTDPLATVQRDDGFGNKNAVIYL